jgi:hypothetical protein
LQLWGFLGVDWRQGIQEEARYEQEQRQELAAQQHGDDLGEDEVDVRSRFDRDPADSAATFAIDHSASG